MKKTVEWILRYWNSLRKVVQSPAGLAEVKIAGTRKPPHLTVEEMNNNEKEVLNFVQQAVFPEALRGLNKSTNTEQIKGSISLFKLDPTLSDGLFCVGGNRDRALIWSGAKYQIILSKNNHMLRIITC